MWFIFGLLAVGVGAWFMRRLFPALFAVVFVLAVPVWLLGGFLLDLACRPFQKGSFQKTDNKAR